jgi:hypothetical protein
MSFHQDFQNTSAKLREVEPSNYERVPDILDYLTYIHQEIDEETGMSSYARRRLSPIEKELYRVIKRSARNTICWKNRDGLAFEVNCSAGAITNAKRILEMPFEQLRGRSLIDVEERRIATYKEGKQINTRPNHCIYVNPIWEFNKKFMQEFDMVQYLEKYQCGEISNLEAEVIIEKMRQSIEEDSNVHNSGAEFSGDGPLDPKTMDDTPSQRTPSRDDIKHTPYKHTPLCNTYSPHSDESERRRICFLKKDFECRDAYDVEKWLIDFGVNKKVVLDIMSRYGWQSIYGRIVEFKRNVPVFKIRKSIIGALLSYINVGRKQKGIIHG